MLAGMLPPLSPSLSLARASVPEGGVSGAKSFVGGGWVENEGWNRAREYELITEDVR